EMEPPENRRPTSDQAFSGGKSRDRGTPNRRFSSLRPLYKSSGNRLGRLGGRGKISEAKSGTARKGDAARSELCPGLLRSRENAMRFGQRGSQAARFGKESRGGGVASAS